MTSDELADVLSTAATELAVPGASAALSVGGVEQYAVHGVTSAENPLPVDRSTLFQSGSIGKTFTSTALLRLVERGQLDLDAPVRRYLPTLRLKDPAALEAATVLHLLNHTAGWDGDFLINTGEGDDALERYVERVIEIDQVTPVGQTVSYNNTSLVLAGRILEVLTGTTYEAALHDLVLAPLGLDETFFFANDVMTRRFAVGHQRHPDGRVTVMRPWTSARSGNPAGGMSTTSTDLLRWGRFHLGDGRAPDGRRLLSAVLLQRMQQPTADMRGSALGDYVGISWLLRDAGGVRVVAHGGTTLGQHSELVLVPEKELIVTCLTNCSPNGAELNRAVSRWALRVFAGVNDATPEPGQRSGEALAEYAGVFETVAVTCTIDVEGERLLVRARSKPEMAKELGFEEDDEDDDEPIPLGLLGEDGDAYVVVDGPAKGMRGYFERDADGAVRGVHIGGRLARRVAQPATAGSAR